MVVGETFVLSPAWFVYRFVMIGDRYGGGGIARRPGIGGLALLLVIGIR